MMECNMCARVCTKLVWPLLHRAYLAYHTILQWGAFTQDWLPPSHLSVLQQGVVTTGIQLYYWTYVRGLHAITYCTYMLLAGSLATCVANTLIWGCINQQSHENGFLISVFHSSKFLSVKNPADWSWELVNWWHFLYTCMWHVNNYTCICHLFQFRHCIQTQYL